MAKEQSKIETIVIRNHVQGKADVNVHSKRRLPHSFLRKFSLREQVPHP